jgi:hypothetical protein
MSTAPPRVPRTPTQLKKLFRTITPLHLIHNTARKRYGYLPSQHTAALGQ